MTDWRPISEAPTTPERVYYEGLIRVVRGPRVLAKGGNLARVEIVRWSQKGALLGVWINDRGHEVKPALFMDLPV